MVAGGDADPHVAVGDFRLFGHDADVGHQRHGEARPDRSQCMRPLVAFIASARLR